MNPESIAHLQSLAGAAEQPEPARPKPREVGEFVVALLNRFDMHLNRGDEGRLWVCDDDTGARLFVFPAGISVDHLSSVLRYASRQYTDGKVQGALEAQAVMRQALGFKD